MNPWTTRRRKSTGWWLKNRNSQKVRGTKTGVLTRGLYRNKVNARAKRCLANCQSVVGVVLLATTKAFTCCAGISLAGYPLALKVLPQKWEVEQASIAISVPGSNCRTVSCNLEREIFLFHATEPLFIQTQTWKTDLSISIPTTLIVFIWCYSRINAVSKSMALTTLGRASITSLHPDKPQPLYGITDDTPTTLTLCPSTRRTAVSSMRVHSYAASQDDAR